MLTTIIIQYHNDFKNLKASKTHTQTPPGGTTQMTRGDIRLLDSQKHVFPGLKFAGITLE